MSSSLADALISSQFKRYNAPPTFPNGFDDQVVSINSGAVMQSLQDAFTRLAEFGRLEVNWDREGGLALTLAASAAARIVLLAFVDIVGFIPQVVPMRDGGALIEAAINGVEVDLQITPRGTVEWFLSIDDQDIGPGTVSASSVQGILRYCLTKRDEILAVGA